ncbi:MAG TPA: AAA family ATPase [Acidimicrobiaceae bacterium]|nr:AAA family ATPase [Acidimicrobiaceae bacterium]
MGKRSVIDLILAALLADGHILLEDVPGVGKTSLAKALAASIEGTFGRVQFTPDLLPTDVSGVTIYRRGRDEFEFRPGPIFANIVLADEINRASPKTQSALLEAMAERQVTVDGSTYPLAAPFLVIATQNPIEHEGTFPLPEAQLDRFLFKLTVAYPDATQEQEILARHHAGLDPHDPASAGVRAVAGAANLAAGRAAVQRIDVEPAVLGYVVALARATRESPSLGLGVSPRGAAMLLHAAKAWAWLAGRTFLTPDEVKTVVKPTFRHRVQVRPELQLEGTTADAVLDGILASVPAPR